MMDLSDPNPFPTHHECPDCAGERWPSEACEREDQRVRKAWWVEECRRDDEAIKIMQDHVSWMDPELDGGVRRALERILGLSWSRIYSRRSAAGRTD